MQTGAPNYTFVYHAAPPQRSDDELLPHEAAVSPAGVPSSEFHHVSFVHGDLNGDNILVDGHENVWVIDFFHTGRGHILKDLAKLENDLLYIFTAVPDDPTLDEGLAILRALQVVQDLQAPLPELCDGVRSPQMRRAWRVLRVLRGFGATLCRSDRDPVQLSVALLRYAMHTTAFDESSVLQKRWALAAACGWAEAVATRTLANRKLRIDWLHADDVLPHGRLGITLCPGRRDQGRALDADLDALCEQGTTHLVSLTTSGELEWAGVPDLRQAVERRGIRFDPLPIRDQGVPSLDDARHLVNGILATMDNGAQVVVHCMGGLGRSGTIAACALVARGLTPADAIARVRLARGPRAIEVTEQARFVERFGAVR